MNTPKNTTMQQITHGASTGLSSVGHTDWRSGAPWLLALALLAGAPACVGTIVGPELGDVDNDGSTRDPGADGAPGDTSTNSDDPGSMPQPDDSAVTYQCDRAAPSGQVYYVATSGNDSTGDGSSARPWATIRHAVESAADGATVLVRPGTYQGTVRVEGHFEQGLTVRSEVPYQARLRSSSGHVMRCFACSGVTIEGFDMAHDNSSSAGPLVFQIQGDSTHHVTVRDNILHDSYNNDVLKVNNGAAFVTVERNVFYNQRGSDEHIDVNSVSDVVIQDNVFLNDFAASGRINGNDTSSYIVIKDSNGDDDRFVGARRITVRRNVFMSWEGSLATNYVLVGEDAADYIEASEVLIENNLMLGNSPNVMRSPLGVKSGHDVVFRNNTVVGDLPASAYAMRLNVENPVVQNNNIMLFNNIWADPTGTMNRFSATPIGETGTYVLDNNLYWNGGQALPLRAADMINYTDDSHRVEGDPQLGGQAGLIAPTWNGTTFNDGSSDSCAVFEHMVALYGTPAAGSAAIDRARADNAPDHDILGRPRQSPDIGALERQ